METFTRLIISARSDRNVTQKMATEISSFNQNRPIISICMQNQWKLPDSSLLPETGRNVAQNMATEMIESWPNRFLAKSADHINKYAKTMETLTRLAISVRN